MKIFITIIAIVGFVIWMYCLLGANGKEPPVDENGCGECKSLCCDGCEKKNKDGEER